MPGICLWTQKTGGREGLPSGKPLRRLRRADENNDILRLVNDNLLQSVEQTTSAPNAVGVRRRHTLPGLPEGKKSTENRMQNSLITYLV